VDRLAGPGRAGVSRGDEQTGNRKLIVAAIGRTRERRVAITCIAVDKHGSADRCDTEASAWDAVRAAGGLEGEFHDE